MIFFDDICGTLSPLIEPLSGSQHALPLKTWLPGPSSASRGEDYCSAVSLRVT